MGLLDDAKNALSGDNAEGLKDKAQHIAAEIDEKAEELSGKDGMLGDIAGKAHSLLDKVDGD